MKRLFAAIIISLALALLMVFPILAEPAHEIPAGPPTISGYDYAQTHIVPLAQDGILGQDHKPGSHQGLANFPP